MLWKVQMQCCGNFRHGTVQGAEGIAVKNGHGVLMRTDWKILQS
jgi:hypothetical protein